MLSSSSSTKGQLFLGSDSNFELEWVCELLIKKFFKKKSESISSFSIVFVDN